MSACALWRMETALVPLLARESSRPYFVYSSFYPAERAYTRMFEEIHDQDVMMPSPLAGRSCVGCHPPFPDRLFRRNYLASSPRGPDRELSLSAYDNGAMIDAAGRRLEGLRQRVDVKNLLARLPVNKPDAELGPPVLLAQTPARPESPAQQAGGQSDQQQLLLANASPAQQSARNVSEYNVRAQQQVKVQGKGTKGKPLQKATASMEPARADASPSTIREGVMTPLWVGDNLLLARRVTVAGTDYVQGCWLDWPSIRQDLKEEIGDLLAGAELTPCGGRRT